MAVPSRTDVEAYQEIRALVDGLVGRINGAFGTPRWVPVTTSIEACRNRSWWRYTGRQTSCWLLRFGTV